MKILLQNYKKDNVSPETDSYLEALCITKASINYSYREISDFPSSEKHKEFYQSQKNWYRNNNVDTGVDIVGNSKILEAFL